MGKKIEERNKELRNLSKNQWIGKSYKTPIENRRKSAEDTAFEEMHP